MILEEVKGVEDRYAVVKRWILPGIWLIIVTVGTYYLFFRLGR